MNTKLKCLLIDDEIPGLTYLKMLCEQIPELEVIKAFNNPEVFLSERSTLNFDLCILDIEMPGTTGIEIASILKDKPVIFVTAHKKYAAEAFELDAVDFVQKPIQFERLRKAVLKVQRLQTFKNKQQSLSLTLNSDKGRTTINPNHILYIKTSEIDSRDKDVYLNDGNRLCIKNTAFSKIESMLAVGQFCRINKQELIQLNIVRQVNGNKIITILKNSRNEPVEFLIGEIYRNSFFEKINL